MRRRPHLLATVLSVTIFLTQGNAAGGAGWRATLLLGHESWAESWPQEKAGLD